MDGWDDRTGRRVPTGRLGRMTRLGGLAGGVLGSAALRGAGDTRWIMTTSITVHWLMLIVQYFVIVVFGCAPMVSWWVFVAMLLSLAVLYLGRLFSGRWRHPDRLARVMRE